MLWVALGPWIWGASAAVANLVGPLLGGLLTLTLGWRADWWALVPLALLAISLIVRYLPATTGGARSATSHPASNAVVLAATLVAAVTFAVMIGSFYLTEQYLQRAAGYSPLGASTVLAAVALLVGGAAPLAGRLVDRRGERLPAILGFLAVGLGLGILAIPAVSLRSAASFVPLVPIGLGLGMLFVATSRAALNATPTASHGRTSAVLSLGRLIGAAVGAGLAGTVLAGGLSAATLHTELLYAFALCMIAGIPASALFGGPPAVSSHEAGASIHKRRVTFEPVARRASRPGTSKNLASARPKGDVGSEPHIHSDMMRCQLAVPLSWPTVPRVMGRCRHVEPPSRPGEGHLARDRNEIPKMKELHEANLASALRKARKRPRSAERGGFEPPMD